MRRTFLPLAAESDIQAEFENASNLLTPPARILIVDDEILAREILSRKLSSVGYACSCFDTGHAAIASLAERRCDLLICDLTMPDMSGVLLMKHARKISPDIGVILVTSVVDIELAVHLLKQGALDYITKPFRLDHVVLSVARALEKRRLVLENRDYQKTLENQVASRTQQLKEALHELEQTYHSTLVALGTALDSRGADSEYHSIRVTMYTKRIASKLGLGPSELRPLEQGALLHDIGKIGIPDRLLRKPERLDAAEWSVMRQHPEIGFRILSKIKCLSGAADVVLHHHERYDGSGYPSGLGGDQIELGARIFAVADTLDCMTSSRPFQPASSFETALSEIRRVSGTQLDPTVVNAFLEIPVHEWRSVRDEVAAGVRRNSFWGTALRIQRGRGSQMVPANALGRIDLHPLRTVEVMERDVAP